MLRPTKPRQQAHSRRILCGGAMAFAFGIAVPAQAQVISSGGTTRADVQLGFIGTVRNSIMLTITGTGSTEINPATSAIMPTHAAGTINFGTFNTRLQPGPTNGQGYRVNLPAPGAVVAATLDAMLTYNGAATATMTVRRLNPVAGPPDVPLADLRVAAPALVTWSAGTDGAQVPAANQPGYNLCTSSGDATCINEKPYPHSLAVFLPDSRSAGAFTTVVLYDGTMP
jgi:hypothetical protein